MKKSYLKYLLSMLLFGANGIVASHIGQSSYVIVLLRTLLGSLFLALIFLITKQKVTFLSHKKDTLFICISGVAMGMSWMFLYEAYAQIGVSISSLLYYCGPVIVMALSPVLFKEKLSIIKIAGFIAVLSGVYLINADSFESGKNLFGIFCGLMSAVTYSVMVMANKKSIAVRSVENSLIQLVASFVTVSVFVMIKSGFAFDIKAEDWVWILILGLVNTGFGCYLYFSSIGNLPVQSVAVCGYLEVLSAVVLSAVILGEKMLPYQIAGGVLIIGGALFAECVKTKQKRY